jgi:hypothetical protein
VVTSSNDFNTDDLIDSELEPGLPEQRNDKTKPVLIGVAVVGFIVGLFLWGSVVSTLASTTSSLFDNAVAETPVNATVVTEEEVGLNCDDYGKQRALSASDEAAYQAQCLTTTPEAAVTSTPDTRVNRADCAAIRGTDYHSAEERQWFLANCVAN